MVTLNKIYTKTGDEGLTSLGDGSRISKNDIRVEAYGTIDEANSIIGVVRSYTKTSELIILDNFLSSIQNELFDLGAELSTPSQDENRKLSISQSQIDRLEQEIDQLNINLTALKSFVLPGGTAASSFLHLARTTIRRAERLMVELSAKEKKPNLLTEEVTSLLFLKLVKVPGNQLPFFSVTIFELKRKSFCSNTIPFI